MNHVTRQIVKDQAPASLKSFSLVETLKRIKHKDPLNFIWWCLALCVSSGTLLRYLAEPNGWVYAAMTLLGSGGCAWFWLLSRSLFRDRKALDSKAVLLVPVVIVVEAFVALMPPASFSGSMSELFRVFSNVASFVCIAAIVFVWNEVLTGFSKIRSKHERHFRIAYLGMFSIPVAVAILWVMGAEADTLAAEWNDKLLTFCAIVALVGSRLAVEYRLYTLREKRPLSEEDLLELSEQEQTKLLADNILKAINSDVLLTQANLKVSDLAVHLGAQEYKVTRCITNTLNYRNFNHMVNKHRIDRALEMLKNPDKSHFNIATIAFDCGYNSLGPFNRAFKQHTDKTPSQFRQE